MGSHVKLSQSRAEPSRGNTNYKYSQVIGILDVNVLYEALTAYKCRCA